MRKDQPELSPKMIRGRGAWWYEDARGIEIIVGTAEGLATAISLRIPWSQLLRAAQRSSRREVIVKKGPR